MQGDEGLLRLIDKAAQFVVFHQTDHIGGLDMLPGALQAFQRQAVFGQAGDAGADLPQAVQDAAGQVLVFQQEVHHILPVHALFDMLSVDLVTAQGVQHAAPQQIVQGV